MTLETWSEAEGEATRRTLPPQAAYVLVAAVIGLALFASATPSPIYGIYRDLWGFSQVVLTLVYATYAFGVLAALLRPAASPTRWGGARCCSSPSAR